MSILALSMAFLFLSMHACNARHTFDFVSYTKDVEKKKLDEFKIKDLPLSNTKDNNFGRKAASMAASDEKQSTVEVQNLKSNKARSMGESEAPKEMKEKTHHDVVTETEGDEPVEEGTAMDYVAAHRATPIHNLN